MKKSLIFLLTFILIVSINPAFASVKTVSAGIGPSSFFYFFDIAFEEINLFFTFDAEKKAETALEYADERIAELAEISKDKTPKVYTETVNRYQKQIAYAKYIATTIEQEEQKKDILDKISEKEKNSKDIMSVVVTGENVGMPENFDDKKETRPLTRFMKIGAQGDDVCVLQKILKAENVLDGKVTCYYGSKTHWAVSSLVNKYGYFQTPDNFGTVDKTAMDLINRLYTIDKNGSLAKNTNADIEVAVPTLKNETRSAILKQPEKSLNLEDYALTEKESTKQEKAKLSVQDKIRLVSKSKNIYFLNQAKNELETVYVTVETNKRLVKNELYFLNNRVNDLESTISYIKDCKISNASSLDRVNSMWDRNIEETKRIYQKEIDRRRAMGFEDSAILTEKELADKLKEKEESREIAINEIKLNCSDSLKNSLKKALSDLRKNISEISKYSNSYASLQKNIVTELGKIEVSLKHIKNGKDVNRTSIYNDYSSKIIEIIYELDSINSEVKSKISRANNAYSKSIENAFKSDVITRDVISSLNSISDKAEADYKKWKANNTPLKCWFDTNYSGGLINGKSETSIRCETGTTNPVHCWSTTEYKGDINGTSQTSMRCE